MKNHLDDVSMNITQKISSDLKIGKCFYLLTLNIVQDTCCYASVLIASTSLSAIWVSYTCLEFSKHNYNGPTLSLYLFLERYNYFSIAVNS
jgi:hypothetical protein